MIADMGSTTSSAPVVDVIIPVYRGLDETWRCLESVLAFSQRATGLYPQIIVRDKTN